jgi:hypothetical protein
MQVLIQNMQQWVGSEQGLGRLNVSTFRLRGGALHKRELGDMVGQTAENLFPLRERGRILINFGRSRNLVPREKCTQGP